MIKKNTWIFSPAATNQEKLKDEESLRNSLFALSEKDIPLPCFVLSMKSRTSPADPLETVKQLSNKYTYNESNTLPQMWLNLPDQRTHY